MMNQVLCSLFCWGLLLGSAPGQPQPEEPPTNGAINSELNEELLDDVLTELQRTVQELPTIQFSHEFKWRSKGGKLYKDILTTKIAGEKFRFGSENDTDIVAFDGQTYQYYSEPRDLVRLGKVPDSFGVDSEWSTGPLLMLWEPIIDDAWEMDGLTALQNSDMWADFRSRIKKIERKVAGDKEVVVVHIDNDDMQHEVTLDPEYGYLPVKFIVDNPGVIGEVVANEIKKVDGPTGPFFIPLEVESKSLKEKAILVDDAIKTVRLRVLPDSIKIGSPMSDKEFIIPSTLASRVFDADKKMFIKRTDISQSGSP